MYLLDTDIISAASPLKHDDTQTLAVNKWLAATSVKLFLSAVTIAEIEMGIAKAGHTGASRKARLLSDWLEFTLHLYADRILPLDSATARIAGRLLDQASGRGGNPGFEDAAIAATAFRANLTVVTRNIRHFQLMDVAVIDPFDTLPAL